MDLIPDTYTDEDIMDTYLVSALYDKDIHSERLAKFAISARRKVNTYLGRTTNFTPTQLAEEACAGIVDAASQLTACLMQLNPQERAMTLTENTKVDCAEAYKTLKNWALQNGITPPDMMKAPVSQKSKIAYTYSEKEHVI